MTASALGDLPLDKIGLLLVENVGNLVCPAEFKIGEDLKILIASTPEGDDKPYKYPLMFHEADVVLINKVDLLPHLKFDVDAFTKAVRGINKKAKIFPVSCTTGQGIDDWVGWLEAKVKS
jgi:hydrogenase nickel incorporation protein HypB